MHIISTLYPYLVHYLFEIENTVFQQISTFVSLVFKCSNFM